MFTSLADGLASGISGDSVINNALLESFTIHTRILLDFLYAASPKKDDVIAEDFFDDPAKWCNKRPQKSEKVLVHRRVGKEIAHLTYARQKVTQETKPWAFIEIANEVNRCLQLFLDLLPLELLGQSWDEYKSQRDTKDIIT
ncbi:MAG: hypothetical protein ABSE08_21200 [Syntrophobacteraceae bacterium]|jgi:hypothetical protein